MLYLNKTEITNAGLKELGGLDSLCELSLAGTKVSDAGLKELAGLKNLTLLHLEGTPVTDVGIARLHKVLPGCRTSRDRVVFDPQR